MKYTAVVVPKYSWVTPRLLTLANMGYEVCHTAAEAIHPVTRDRIKICIVGTEADTVRYRGLKFTDIEFHGVFHGDAVAQMNTLVRKDN